MTKQHTRPATIKEMVGLAFGSQQEKLAEIEMLFEGLQEQLAGKKGELALLYFTCQVPDRHVFGKGYTYRSETSFRVGKLEGEELVWAELGGNFASITLPVSRYACDEALKLVEENIFAQYRGEKSPPLLGIHIVPHVASDSFFRLGGPRPSTINEILIGDKAVQEWIRTHLIRKDIYNKIAALFGKLPLEPFELTPLGPNDGPLPQSSLTENEEFVDRLIDEIRTTPLV